jgi:predicted AAA+ superfamily ATPase
LVEVLRPPLETALGLRTMGDLENNPKLGASWEGFLLSELASRLNASKEECYFWATHQGAGLDLLVIRGNQRLGFEFKRTSSPTITKSMHIAMRDLMLDQLTVIHAGEHSFPLSGEIQAVSAKNLLTEIHPLR